MCKKECSACPFNFFSEESMQVQNYGCLPEPSHVIDMYKEHDAVWGCHETSEEEGNLKACVGFLKYAKRNGIKVEPKGKIIVDYSQWYKDGNYYLKNANSEK